MLIAFQNPSIRKVTQFAGPQSSKRAYTNHWLFSPLGKGLLFGDTVHGTRPRCQGFWILGMALSPVGWATLKQSPPLSGPPSMPCKWSGWPWSSLSPPFQHSHFINSAVTCHGLCVVIPPPTNPSFIFIAQPHTSTQRSGHGSSDTLQLCLPW